MLINESLWIKDTLANYFSDNDFPLLNIGSSTEEFRNQVQPHIQQNIFLPLENKRLAVIHLDMKSEKGVDMVGDLNDESFRQELSAKNIRSVLCSNLLEHLEAPQKICRSILSLLDPKGLILVTVPYRFPYHKDPIDTMLRPSVQELHAFFPGTEIVTSAVVEENGNFKKSLMANKKYFLIMVVRWCLPFYKFREWKWMIMDLFRWNRKHAATCMLLRKI